MAGTWTLATILDPVANGVRWLCGRSPLPTAHLDEEAQRRMVLRWAREHSPGSLRQVRKRCPTPAEMEQELRELILCSMVFCPGLCFLWLPPEVLKGYDFRQKLAANWEAWLAEPDADCEQWALEGELRRRLRKMPRKLRQAAAAAKAELDRISLAYSDLCRKREQLDSALAALGGSPADRDGTEVSNRALELHARSESESEPQIGAIPGCQALAGEQQDAARLELEAWRARVTASQRDCSEGLRRLRTRLALLEAADLRSVGSGEQALASLNELNGQLAATLAASDEVLRIGRAA